MKRTIQMLLASFGVMALMLAGCNSDDDTVVEDDEEMDEAMDESADTTVDAEVDAEMEDAQ